MIDLQEFQKVTKISDRTLVFLLGKGAIPITLGSDHKIMIDMERVEIKKLVHALNREHSAEETAEFNLLVEEAGRIIREEFDSLITTANQRTNKNTDSTK